VLGEANPDQQALLEPVEKFCREELPALAEECERTAKPPSREWRKKFAQLGVLGLNTEEKFGGLGLSATDAVMVLERFASVSSAAAFPLFEALVGPVRIVERFGAPELAQRIVPAVIAGDMVVAISMSEPQAGTALTDLKTRGRFDGDEIVLTGTKRWCSGGGHADAYAVFCRLSDEPGARGVGAVLVEADTPGLRFGAQEQLMGWRGISSADIHLDEVRVPKENLLMDAGGFAKLMGAFNLERCGNATMSLGISVGALREAKAYIQERAQFGKPLIDFQAVQLRLAEMAIKVDATRLLIYRATSSKGADGFPDNYPTLIAKCFANESVRDVAGAGVQLMGGYGYAKEYGMEQRLRDGWGWGIAGGSIDIQKVNISAAIASRRFDQRR
jgi:butyryl-CoA dehydrogenase